MLTWRFSFRRREAGRLNRDAASIIKTVQSTAPSERARDIALRFGDTLEAAHARGDADPSRYAPLIAHFKLLHREARRRHDEVALTVFTLVIIYLRAEMLGPDAAPARDCINTFVLSRKHDAAPVSERL